MTVPDSGSAPPEVGAAWYATAFDALYPLLYAHRSVEAAKAEADFAMRHLRLGHCGKILDLCCGGGRHLIHLSSYCVELVGLDYSRDLLRIANDHLPANVLLTRGDMRHLPFEAAFDAVVNFFTSFGYFEEDSENARVPRQMALALRPGGRFFMDYLNPAHVRANLLSESRREAGNLTVLEERWIDSARSRVNKRTKVLEAGGVRTETFESVRLYSFEEMHALLGASGLVVEQVFGDYDGSPHKATSPRMMFVGSRE
ncbi:MAG: hypothetical protein RLZZ303_465 [Candidatus Hydrogenedentota bacterium]